MQLLLAAFCDSANESKDGKLNMLGIFQGVTASQVPSTHPFMAIATRFQIELSDVGATRVIQIEIVDPEGKSFARTGEVKVGTPAGAVAPLPACHAIFNIAGLPLQRFGPYSFNIHVSGSLVKTLTLEVVQMGPNASQGRMPARA